MQVEKLIPDIYIRESRDFAFISRLVTIVFNYMKTASDCVYSSYKSSDTVSGILELAANNVGFETKHAYNSKNLLSVIKCFSQIIKKKGTLEAITLAVKMLLNSQNIKNINPEALISVDSTNKEITIKIPNNIEDITLLEDIFNYILPAGMIYKFIKVVLTDSVYQNNISVASDKDIIIDDSNILSDIITATIKTSESPELALLPDTTSKHMGTVYTGTTLADIEN